MSEKFKINILTPSDITQKKGSIVTIPGEEGELGILNNHANMIAKLKSGTIVIDNTDKMFISDGFAHMKDNNLSIITDLIEYTLNMSIEEATKKRDSSTTDAEYNFYSKLVNMISKCEEDD